MEKYQFLMDGHPVSVYPFTGASYDRTEALSELKDGELAVVLLPDGDADFLVTSFDKNNSEPREPYFVFAALSCFFKEVRGYPKMALDVKYREKMYEVALSDGKLKISVNVAKSKVLCTKTVKFADGIEIEAHAVDCGNTVVAILCYDADLFDKARLRLLLSSFLDKGARSAAAVSFDGKIRIKTLGQPMVYEAITAGAVALSIGGVRLADGEYACLVDGKEKIFFKDKNNLFFYPRIDPVG